jgi:3-hydroxybutyryl-CoA dehydrogenase
MSEIQNISIIGAGLMGHGIAQVFAQNGYPVTLMDLNEELLANAAKNIRANLTLMAENGIGSYRDIDPVISRIKFTMEMSEAASEADFVVEAVSEKLDLKQDIFRKLDTLCGRETILATNTSVISITDIASKSIFRDRICCTHSGIPHTLSRWLRWFRGKGTHQINMDKTFSPAPNVGKTQSG